MEFSVVGIRPNCPKAINTSSLFIHPPVNSARPIKTGRSSPSTFPSSSGVQYINHCSITCTVEGRDSLFSKKNNESERGNSRKNQMVGASLALGCALGIISCTGMTHHKIAFASLSPASSTLTMEKVARTNIEVKTAMDLLMHSKGADEAEKYVRKTIKAYDEDLEAGYRGRVALIEVLMHRGKYKEAAELCHLIRENKNYNHLLEKDRKLHLVQVFIYGMLNDGKKAKQFWKKFKKTYYAGWE